MHRILFGLLAILGPGAGCVKVVPSTPEAPLSPGEFTERFASALRDADPGLTATILKDLEVSFTTSQGFESDACLYNAYALYYEEPGAIAEVLNTYVGATLELPETSEEAIDRQRIVPVIKDRAWIPETNRDMLSRGVTDLPEYVADDFNSELVILYAHDSPKNIRYLKPEDLADVGIEHSQLRQLACENLKRLLPPIEQQGSDVVFRVTAGDHYDASLLVLDSVWNGGQISVDGEIVVAIPRRDLLLVTGSNDKDGLETLRALASEESTETAYRLTKILFVYRNGAFETFEDGSEADTATDVSSQ